MDAEPRIRAAGAPIAIDVAADGRLACISHQEKIQRLKALSARPTLRVMTLFVAQRGCCSGWRRSLNALVVN
jgi:hypothetical protein